MSFIERMMQICERVLSQTVEQKANTPDMKDVPVQPKDTQSYPKREVN